jgi:hypothetical protein
MIRDRLGCAPDEDFCTDGNDDFGSGVQSQTDAAANAAGYAALYPNGAPTSSGGISLTTLANSALNDAAALAAPIIKASTQQKPYYITSPTGQSVLYNPNTGTTSTGIARTLGSISPTYLLLGAAALAAVMLSGSKK